MGAVMVFVVPLTVSLPVAVVATVCPSVSFPPVREVSSKVAFGNCAVPSAPAPLAWLSRSVIPVFSVETGTVTVPFVAARSCGSSVTFAVTPVMLPFTFTTVTRYAKEALPPAARYVAACAAPDRVVASTSAGSGSRYLFTQVVCPTAVKNW